VGTGAFHRDPAGQAPSAHDERDARLAIWRLFEQGGLDANAATARLLAVDVARRRALAARRGTRRRLFERCT
jgi:hypothetical protein